MSDADGRRSWRIRPCAADRPAGRAGASTGPAFQGLAERLGVPGAGSSVDVAAAGGGGLQRPRRRRTSDGRAVRHDGTPHAFGRTPAGQRLLISSVWLRTSSFERRAKSSSTAISASVYSSIRAVYALLNRSKIPWSSA